LNLVKSKLSPQRQTDRDRQTETDRDAERERQTALFFLFENLKKFIKILQGAFLPTPQFENLKGTINKLEADINETTPVGSSFAVAGNN